MYKNNKIAVIIPALNEEDSLEELFSRIPRYVDTIICVDNGSTDGTFRIMEKWSLKIPVKPAREFRRGYGWACLKGMSLIEDEDITVFLDADLSDDPELLHLLLEPIAAGEADFTVSNRFTSRLEKGAMSPPQYWGNKFSVLLIRLIWGYRYRDLGPFRAVRTPVLFDFRMDEKEYGWTVEMQIKALKKRIAVRQADLPYHTRHRGRSKVSKTVRGVVRAGTKIIRTIFRLGLSTRPF